MKAREWTINTIEDYNKAMETLENDKWLAYMGEGAEQFRREMAIIEKQIAEVKRQAKEKGII